MNYHEFYMKILNDLLQAEIINKQMRILVVCGDEPDRRALRESGFTNVVISNIDSRLKGDEFAPYEWAFQDAENLTYEDNVFDFSIVCSGLHHCASPHRALLEMYRVAQKGLLLFEPYDSLMTKLGVLFNVGQEYEHAEVYRNSCTCGGIRNTVIPNYVYRWTERDIIKTIHTFAPHGEHTFQFIHKMNIPWTQLMGRKKKLAYYAVLLAVPLLKIIEIMAPKQSTGFAAVVLKPELPRNLHPWLYMEAGEIKLNLEWLENRYGEMRWRR